MQTENPSRTALVVADNRETVLRAVSATLEKAGFTVLATSNGAEALRYFREGSRPVELAIIDSEAAGINAAELAGQLDAISPITRTLVLAASDRETELRGAGNWYGILRKPFRRSQLLGHVLEMLDRPKTLTA